MRLCQRKRKRLRLHTLSLLLLSLLVLMESCGHFEPPKIQSYQVYPDGTLGITLQPDALLFKWTGQF